jgi:hypothetical protein
LTCSIIGGRLQSGGGGDSCSGVVVMGKLPCRRNAARQDEVNPDDSHSETSFAFAGII